MPAYARREIFDESVVGPLDQVTAPPYDAISTEGERRLHAASAHNVVRLILGRDEPGDDDRDNKYTRASRLLREWRTTGALRETERPSWFLYEMRFAFRGRPGRVRGVIAAVDVEPLGGAVVPHERTLPKAKSDRLALLRATRANLDPIWVLSPAAGLSALAAAPGPSVSCLDAEGVRHSLTVIQDPERIGAISSLIAGDSVVLADGHHRYETALNYRAELVESGKPVTAEVLSDIYFGLLKTYHGDAYDYDDLARVTWARIPHFYSTPYYVYQYATCFASSAQLMKQLSGGSDTERNGAIDRYLTLLKAGGSDHPMTLLQRAGVDLSKPETIRAVVDQLDTLVTQLENEIS